MDPNSTITIPEDRHGLYAIDILDPDLVRLLYTELLELQCRCSINLFMNRIYFF